MKFLLCVDGSEGATRAVDKFIELAKPEQDQLIIYSCFLAASDGYFGTSNSDVIIPSERSEFHSDLQGKRKVAKDALDKAEKKIEEVIL